MAPQSELHEARGYLLPRRRQVFVQARLGDPK